MGFKSHWDVCVLDSYVSGFLASMCPNTKCFHFGCYCHQSFVGIIESGISDVRIFIGF